MEDDLVTEFLNKFLIASESAFNDKIDITLLLKAIPLPIIMKKLDQVKKFNFLDLQAAFIAHSNEDRVDAFEHYDKLNKQRVNTIKNLIIGQYKNLDECKKVT